MCSLNRMTQSSHSTDTTPLDVPADRAPSLRPLLHAGGVGVLALAGAVAAELRHRRSLAGHPEHERFRSPLTGQPLAPVSADGTVLHAEVFGSDHAPTFVLAPGWTETLAFFDSMTRLLVERGFRVVAYDLRGQGASARAVDRDYALARHGDDLEAVLTASTGGRSDVIVAGHSMGGMALAAWAADHEVSGRVRGAVLMNTGLDGLIRASRILPTVLPAVVAQPLALYAFLGNPLPMPHLSTVFGRAAVRYVAFGPHASAAQVAFTERQLMDCAPSVRRAGGLAMSSLDLLGALTRLTVPTLVLAGAADRLTPPSHAYRIAKQLPQSAGVTVFPGVGHMGPLEAPQESVDALAAFAQSLGEPVSLAA
jgi:pimeloyl-ACP methyl ester carboxylesterase